jgi:nicotinamide-nucleotide amidase
MELLKQAEPLVLALGDALRARRWRMASAESCTGGLIAATCTAVAGSSDWFERGFVTYSNEAKQQMLAVPAALIERHGAVSEEVVRAMCAGALRHANAQLAVAVTGIAGPTGAVPGKPVGTVWLAVDASDGANGANGAKGVNGKSGAEVQRLQLDGDRGAVRAATVMHALQRLLAAARR